MKIIKKKLDDNQLLARRRNLVILDSEIADRNFLIEENQRMIDTDIANKRLRKAIVLAKSEIETLEQNKKIAEKELRHKYMEIEDPTPTTQ